MLAILALASCLGIVDQPASAAIPESEAPKDPLIQRECFGGGGYGYGYGSPAYPPSGSAYRVPGAATAGQLRGTAEDDSGLALPGALIRISSTSLIGGSQQLTADENGEFAFQQLPPGRYSVVTQLQGFGKVTRTVEVQIGRVSTVTVQLTGGAADVTVPEGSPVVDTTQASAATTMNSDYLSRIPVGRSSQSALGSAAGVLSGGNPSAAGASGDENTLLLDPTSSQGGRNDDDDEDRSSPRPLTATDRALAARADAPLREKAKEARLDSINQLTGLLKSGPDSAVDTTAPTQTPAATKAPGPDWGATVYLSNDDSMSLASAQRLLWAVQNGRPVQASEVRPHELLNYFSFDTAPVKPGDTFSVLGSAEQTGASTLSVGFAVRGATPPPKPLDLTIVLDRSGSMASEGRMEYLKRGLTKMKASLHTGDRLSFVLFDDSVCTPVENFVMGRDDNAVLDGLIAQLAPRGSTDLDLGLREGYRIANAAPGVKDRNRRMILITDAELNTGSVNPDVVSEIGKAYEDSGVRLTAVGVGRDFNDDILNKLTEKGKGAYVYLGSEAVVDRIFGVGFESLTRTIAHDVHFSVHLPPSLAMQRFYGEESSTHAEDVQPVNYASGTSQLFLQDLTMQGPKPVPTDPVTFLMTWTDPDNGAAKTQSWQTTVGALIAAAPQSVRKARALMAWTDFVLAGAMQKDPCASAFGTWQSRVRSLGPDSEIQWLDGITSPRCRRDAVTFPLRPRPTVTWKLKVDSDVPVASAELQCDDWRDSRALGAGTTSVTFAAPTGQCSLSLASGHDSDLVGSAVAVTVPAVGGASRCLVRAGEITCD